MRAVATTETAHDGRRARRDRNRSAVISAVFDLLEDGSFPTTEALAERAGVSVSSVFRYFESLDDLVRETIEAHFDRFGHLFDIPSHELGSHDARIRALVDARLDLHSAVAPVARLARARAYDQPLIAARLAEIRAAFARQTRSHFSDDLAGRTGAGVDDVVCAIDSATSFESWDLLRSTHDRSRRQIRRVWVDVLTLLLSDR